MVYSQLLPPQSSSSAMINLPHHRRDTSSVGMAGGGQMLLSPLDEIQHQQPHQYTSTDSPGGLYEGISQSFINTSFKNHDCGNIHVLLPFFSRQREKKFYPHWFSLNATK